MSTSTPARVAAPRRHRVAATAVTTGVVIVVIVVGGWAAREMFGDGASTTIGSGAGGPQAGARAAGAPKADVPGNGAVLAGAAVNDPYPAASRAAYLAALTGTRTSQAVLTAAGLDVCLAVKSAVPAADLASRAAADGVQPQDTAAVVAAARAHLCP